MATTVNEHLDDRFIRIKEVVKLTGLSRSTIFRLEAAGKMPPRYQLSARCVAWKLSEIQEFIDSRKPVADVA